jgi:hypothetical protein
MTTLTVAALAREAMKSKRGRSLTPILGTVSTVGSGLVGSAADAEGCGRHCRNI